MDVGEITLFGVSMVIFIPLLVEAFKRLFGLPDNLAPWVTMVLCVLAAGAAALIKAFPDINGPVYVVIYMVVSALGLFLMVTGAYHTTKNVAQAVSKPDPPPAPDPQPTP